MESILDLLVSGVSILLILVIIGVLMSGYVKAAPDQALIISGLRKEPKVLIGKAGIKIPFLERMDKISLKLIPLDIKTGDAVPTADCINIYVDSAVNVKIGSTPEMVSIASQNFLNKNTEQIGQIVAEVLEGNIREIICTMKLRELIGDRKTFVEKVSENVIPDLQNMGLELVSFNVQRFSDANHVIEDLGIDNISQIKKDAAIAKANADKEVEIAQARAEKEANDARVAADLEIANANAKAEKEKAIVKANASKESKEAEIEASTQIAQKENELEIRKAELKKEADSKRAVADAAYQIQHETERKAIEIAEADANLARQEKAILLQEKEVALKEKALEAEVKKYAEAERYAKQQEADAMLYERQKKSEAELFERQKKAEADKFEKEQMAIAMKATADAQKYQMEQEAAGISAKGLAEAEAVKAKLLAEAEGTREKAEAMKQMGEAAIFEMYFKALPEVAKNVASPLGNVAEIKMYGDGNSAKLTKDVMTTMNQITDGMKEATGLDLATVLGSFAGVKLAEK